MIFSRRFDASAHRISLLHSQVQKQLEQIHRELNNSFSDIYCELILQKVTRNPKFVILHIKAKPYIGMYKGVVFRPRVYLGSKYVYTGVKIFNDKNIYHPNIHRITKEICFDLIVNWKPDRDIRHVLQTLKLIFIDPSLTCVHDNPENIDVALMFRDKFKKPENRDILQRKIYQSQLEIRLLDDCKMQIQEEDTMVPDDQDSDLDKEFSYVDVTEKQDFRPLSADMGYLQVISTFSSMSIKTVPEGGMQQ